MSWTMVLKLTRSTICLLICVPLAVTGDDAMDEINPWDETDLDFSFVEERITSRSCQTTEGRYLACILTLEALLAQAPRKLRLLHVNWRIEPGRPARVVARFGSLLVAEVTEPASKPTRNALEEIKVRRQRVLEWQVAYRHSRGQFAEFDEALDWMLSEVVEPGSETMYAAAAINGYISIDDAHAKIFPAFAVTPRGRSGTGGFAPGVDDRRYAGVGVAVQLVAETLMVTSVIEDGPASAAGIYVGDIILAIDGESAAGKSLPEVVARLRGPAGSEAFLTVQTQSVRRNVLVRRDDVEIRDVTSSTIEDGEWRWGHLNVRSFVLPSTCVEVRRELRALTNTGVDGILLDVRDNLGGLIGQAVCVADLFLGPHRSVVEMRSLHDQHRSRTIRTRYPVLSRVPLVTLVNAGTGSASEVLVGGLKDNGRALVVGERTFGKGTMQRVRPWENASGVMQFFTAARMYTPSGRSVQMRGIKPDLEAYNRPEGAPVSKVVLREEDLFPTALPASDDDSGKDVEHPDAGFVRHCVSETGTAEKRWMEDERLKPRGDYPMHVGQDALRCLASDMMEGLTLR